MNNFVHRRITIQMPFADDRDALQQVFMQCHVNERQDVLVYRILTEVNWTNNVHNCFHGHNTVIMFTPQ